MLSTRIRAASMLLAASACPACRTVDRAAQDALVVGMFPIHAVTTPYQETAAAIHDDGVSPWASPLIFAGHFAEDVGVTVLSAGDLGISPALGVAEMASREDEKLEPLRMYTFEEFPPTFHKAQARGVESDFAEGAAKGAIVVVAVAAMGAACYYGGYHSSSSGWTNSPPTAPKRQRGPKNVP